MASSFGNHRSFGISHLAGYLSIRVSGSGYVREGLSFINNLTTFKVLCNLGIFDDLHFGQIPESKFTSILFAPD